MINDADEFYKLRTSENIEEYTRAAHDYATIETWQEVIDKYPSMKEWVVLNKTSAKGLGVTNARRYLKYGGKSNAPVQDATV